MTYKYNSLKTQILIFLKNNTMNKWKCLFMTVCCSLTIEASVLADNRPSGLMTDLLEHTERTWHNGYLSTLPVWKLDAAIEPMQYAAIRSSNPVFSWIVPGKKMSSRQIAYRIILSDNLQDIRSHKGNVWDSGTVSSGQSISVRYKGKPLTPSTNYFWRVKTTTNVDGESDWSEIKAFRTADRISAYAVSYYPQVKSRETPAELKALQPDLYFADFGKDAFAQLLLTLTSHVESDTVTIHLGECTKDGRLLRNPGGTTIRYRKCLLPLLKGTHTYRVKIEKDRRNTGGAAIKMPAYAGEVLPFRYCEIEGYSKPLEPSAVARETVHYPFDETASSFRSSNDTLNQIWELCKYSIKATSFAGIYVDGDRERIPYEADALINQLCHYGTDREYSMARRSYEYLLHHPTWPTEWILQAILIAWHDYMHTGDSRSLEATYERLQARTLLSLREENGLISTTTGLQTPEFLSSISMKSQIKDIVDWPHTKAESKIWDVMGESDGFVFTNYNAVTNAFHYEALKLMGRIAKALDKQEDAEFYISEAEAFRKRYIRHFFDKEKGRFTDGLPSETKHASLHANMFALAFGLVPEGKEHGVVDFIHSRGMACSVYGSQFLLDALYEADDAEYALQMLTKTDDRSWYNMIRVGSTITLEAWDNKYKPNQDWNHAWGAAPANIIPRRLMGIKPLTPGFETIRIMPQTASLEWAEATIPTIRGGVSVLVSNESGVYRLSITIPSNMDAEVYLPISSSGKYRVTMNGAEVKTSRLKNRQYIYVGKVGSGTYTWEVVSSGADKSK